MSRKSQGRALKDKCTAFCQSTSSLQALFHWWTWKEACSVLMGQSLTYHGCAKASEKCPVRALPHQSSCSARDASGRRIDSQAQPQCVQRICHLEATPPVTLQLLSSRYKMPQCTDLSSLLGHHASC